MSDKLDIDEAMREATGEAQIKQPTGALAKNVGESNYSQKQVQPWQIWLAYPELNAWEADIVKRILRTKGRTPEQRRANKIMDLEKIRHICDFLLENQEQIYANTDDKDI